MDSTFPTTLPSSFPGMSSRSFRIKKPAIRKKFRKRPTYLAKKKAYTYAPQTLFYNVGSNNTSGNYVRLKIKLVEEIQIPLGLNYNIYNWGARNFNAQANFTRALNDFQFYSCLGIGFKFTVYRIYAQPDSGSANFCKYHFSFSDMTDRIDRANCTDEEFAMGSVFYPGNTTFLKGYTRYKELQAIEGDLKWVSTDKDLDEWPKTGFKTVMNANTSAVTTIGVAVVTGYFQFWGRNPNIP